MVRMIRIMIRVGGLFVMLIVGVFLGIDSAEKNIQKMQGVEGSPRTIEITPQSNGKFQISLMGKSIEATNPLPDLGENPTIEEAKKTAQQEVKRIASVGNLIGSSLKNFTKDVVDFIANLLKD